MATDSVEKLQFLFEYHPQPFVPCGEPSKYHQCIVTVEVHRYRARRDGHNLNDPIGAMIMDVKTNMEISPGLIEPFHRMVKKAIAEHLGIRNERHYIRYPDEADSEHIKGKEVET